MDYILITTESRILTTGKFGAGLTISLCSGGGKNVQGHVVGGEYATREAAHKEAMAHAGQILSASGNQLEIRHEKNDL